MRFAIFLIFLPFFVSEIQESAICVEEIESGETAKFFAFEFLLEFKHSIYGGSVMLNCKVVDKKIVILSLESDDEASISYYTDRYERIGSRFVAKIDEKVNAILLNEGWRIKLQANEFETKSPSKISLCVGD
ncbi:MAG: hypothetical protein ACK401_01140 [Archaeoglobaceae archaeon]